MKVPSAHRWGLAVAWLATTALAVGLALAAVGAVSDSVTENRPAPLSAAAVSAALAEEEPPEAETTTATTAPPPATSTRPPATAPATSASTAPATTRPTQPAASTSTSVSTGPGPSTSATTGPGGEGQPEVRTYELALGTVQVRFAGGRAELLSANPRGAGITVKRMGSDESGEVRVTFRSDDHESELRAWWEGGPREEIEEKRR
jgi:hypothetical protein